MARRILLLAHPDGNQTRELPFNGSENKKSQVTNNTEGLTMSSQHSAAERVGSNRMNRSHHLCHVASSESENSRSKMTLQAELLYADKLEPGDTGASSIEYRDPLNTTVTEQIDRGTENGEIGFEVEVNVAPMPEIVTKKGSSSSSLDYSLSKIALGNTFDDIKAAYDNFKSFSRKSGDLDPTWRPSFEDRSASKESGETESSELSKRSKPLYIHVGPCTGDSDNDVPLMADETPKAHNRSFPPHEMETKIQILNAKQRFIGSRTKEEVQQALSTVVQEVESPTKERAEQVSTHSKSSKSSTSASSRSQSSIDVDERWRKISEKILNTADDEVRANSIDGSVSSDDVDGRWAELREKLLSIDSATSPRSSTSYDIQEDLIRDCVATGLPSPRKKQLQAARMEQAHKTGKDADLMLLGDNSHLSGGKQTHHVEHFVSKSVTTERDYSSDDGDGSSISLNQSIGEYDSITNMLSQEPSVDEQLVKTGTQGSNESNVTVETDGSVELSISSFSGPKDTNPSQSQLGKVSPASQSAPSDRNEGTPSLGNALSSESDSQQSATSYHSHGPMEIGTQNEDAHENPTIDNLRKSTDRTIESDALRMTKSTSNTEIECPEAREDKSTLLKNAHQCCINNGIMPGTGEGDRSSDQDEKIILRLPVQGVEQLKVPRIEVTLVPSTSTEGEEETSVSGDALSCEDSLSQDVSPESCKLSRTREDRSVGAERIQGRDNASNCKEGADPKRLFPSEYGAGKSFDEHVSQSKRLDKVDVSGKLDAGTPHVPIESSKPAVDEGRRLPSPDGNVDAHRKSETNVSPEDKHFLQHFESAEFPDDETAGGRIKKTDMDTENAGTSQFPQTDQSDQIKSVSRTSLAEAADSTKNVEETGRSSASETDSSTLLRVSSTLTGSSDESTEKMPEGSGSCVTPVLRKSSRRKGASDHSVELSVGYEDTGSFDTRVTVSSAGVPSWRIAPKKSLSDFEIQILNQGTGELNSYHVHKQAVAVGPRKSEYLEGILRSNSRGSTRLALEEKAANLFPFLLDYMYCHDVRLHITSGTAVSYLHVAQFFQIMPMIISVTEFILKDVSLENLSEYIVEAGNYNEEKVLDFITAKCSHHIEHIPPTSPVWTAMTPDHFVRVMKSRRSDRLKLSPHLSVLIVEYQTLHAGEMDCAHFREVTRESVVPVIDRQAAIPLLEICEEYGSSNDFHALQRRCAAVMASYWKITSDLDRHRLFALMRTLPSSFTVDFLEMVESGIIASVVKSNRSVDSNEESFESPEDSLTESLGKARTLATEQRFEDLNWRMEKEHSFSDWTLRVAHRKEKRCDEYHVHKHVLCLGQFKSKFFSDMFLSAESLP